MMAKRVVFLDFDGVLAIPFNMPEQPYPHIPTLLKYWHDHGVQLHLVSFNPRAWLAVQAWGCAHYFTGVRAGCNEPWQHDALETYTEAMRQDLCKARQIASLLQEHNPHTVELDFWDDDPLNIARVQAVHRNVTCHHVHTEHGLPIPPHIITPLADPPSLHWSFIVISVLKLLLLFQA